MEKITKDFYNETLDKEKELYKNVEVLEKRLDYILTTFFHQWDINLNTWYFEDAKEGEVGNILQNMNSDSVYYIHIETNSKHDKKFHNEEIVIIDKFGKELYWENEIPTRWLFEDFEQEVIDGKAKMEEKNRKSKEKREKVLASRKANAKKIMENIKGKLSKEELKILGVK